MNKILVDVILIDNILAVVMPIENFLVDVILIDKIVTDGLGSLSLLNTTTLIKMTVDDAYVKQEKCMSAGRKVLKVSLKLCKVFVLWRLWLGLGNVHSITSFSWAKCEITVWSQRYILILFTFFIAYCLQCTLLLTIADCF